MDAHPIIAQLAPSDEQRPAALARGKDVAVTAGAGAGKTRTLVARYLSFVAEGVPLRSIVAITFTKKAAREMRNRVRQEIRRYLEATAAPASAPQADGELASQAPDRRAARDVGVVTERARWQEAYTQLDAARIGTIHSLCAEILRRHPAQAGVDPRFDMLEEGQMALLQAQAVDAALGWAAEDRDAARLFADFGERGLRQVLSSMLTQRLDVADARLGLPDDLWEAWAPHLIAPLRAFLDDATVQAEFAELVALEADGSLIRAEAAGDALVPELRSLLHTWHAIDRARQDGDWAAVSRSLAPLRASLKQKGRAANWAPGNPKASIKALQGVYDALLAPLVGDGIDLDVDRRLAQEVVPALFRVLDRALAHYEAAKRARQGLDFDDLEWGALTLLRMHADVREAWQREVRALLVDEFQDTNRRQRDLLEALNGDGGRLFIVGDGKQSIYRFRGADVSVFRQEQAAIADKGERYELATSYRAHRSLIEGLNALLAPVLGVDDEPDRPYVQPFAPLLAHRDSSVPGLHSPYIEMYLAVGGTADGGPERAARALVARLAELVDRADVLLPAYDEETGEPSTRPLNYGDMAILCRASTSFAAYETALERAGIPYLTIAGRGFYDRPEVRDVLNALQALADPTDDLAMAGLLRSPACGLTDMALYRLCEARREQSLDSLWTLLETGDLSALEDEATRAAEARDLVAALHARVGRVPVADVLKAFLDATNYRAALLRAGQTRAANNVAKLLADAHASEIVGMSAFLDYMTQLRDVAPREGEARTLATGAVQIMSVHQAKGLEFPIVVIGDAAKGGRSGSGVCIDARLGVVPPLREEQALAQGLPGEEGDRSGPTRVMSAAYRLARARDADEEAAESDRLLYVAATRAQEMLLISSAVGVTRNGLLSVRGWLSRIDVALGMSGEAPPCDAAGAAVYGLELHAGSEPVRCVIYEPAAPELGAELPAPQTVPAGPAPLGRPDPAMLAPVVPAPVTADAALRDADRDPPRRVWRVVPRSDRAWAPAWVVGQVVHLALRDWLFPGAGAVSGAPGADFYRWAASEARSCGLTDETEVANAVERAARMLARFRASRLYADMDAAEMRLHEVPYSVTGDQGVPDSGVFDALYFTGGQWTLVEFKTDRVRDEVDVDRLLCQADYNPQMVRYLGASERLLGQRPRGLMCFLNMGRRVYVLEDRW